MFYIFIQQFITSSTIQYKQKNTIINNIYKNNKLLYIILYNIYYYYLF